MIDRLYFDIIINNSIIKNNKAKWREKDRKKIKSLVSRSNLSYHTQGVRRKPIFEDEMDYQVLLQILKTSLRKYNYMKI